MTYFVSSEFFSEVVSKGHLGTVTGIYINVDILFTWELWHMLLGLLSSTRSMWALNKHQSIPFTDIGMLARWLHGEKCIDILWFILKRTPRADDSVAFVEPVLGVMVTQTVLFLSCHLLGRWNYSSCSTWFIVLIICPKGPWLGGKGVVCKPASLLNGLELTSQPPPWMSSKSERAIRHFT